MAGGADIFLRPERVWRRDEALSRPSPVPATSGVHGWWSDRLPALIEVSGCPTWRGLTLLYTGISPTRAPRNGCAPSKSHLRERIQTHVAGNAEGSTLRKTLGCLLAVGSDRRPTFVEGEQALFEWVGEQAFVELELGLPLNLEGNSRNAFHAELTRVRSDRVAVANALPVIPNPGVGGR